MYLEMKLTGPFAPLSPLNPQELLGLLKQYVLMSPWLGPMTVSGEDCPWSRQLRLGCSLLLSAVQTWP